MTKVSFTERLTQDLSYKAVALAVALVLWVTMLGRKDISMVRRFPVQYMSESNYEVKDPGKIAEVEVEVIGSRMGLKKFSQTDQIFSLDLTQLREGRHTVRLKKDSISVPVGVRVVALRPEEIIVTLGPFSGEEK